MDACQRHIGIISGITEIQAGNRAKSITGHLRSREDACTLKINPPAYCAGMRH